MNVDSKANEKNVAVDRLVITRQELQNLERARLLIHEVAGRMEDEKISKHQLFAATSILWSVVNLKRDKA